MPLLIAFIAFIIGIFGFSNIIGAIKYPEACKSPAATATLWIFILLSLLIIGCALVPYAIWAPILGYLCSLIPSFNVKPDHVGGSSQQKPHSRPQQTPPSPPVPSIKTDADKLRELDMELKRLDALYDDISDELKTMATPLEAEQFLNSGMSTQDGYNRWKLEYYSAKNSLNSCRSSMQKLKLERDALAECLNCEKAEDSQ